VIHGLQKIDFTVGIKLPKVDDVDLGVKVPKMGDVPVGKRLAKIGDQPMSNKMTVDPPRRSRAPHPGKGQRIDVMA
jgi:hypothetical protein